MEQIHKLRIHNFININSIKYEIIDIKVKHRKGKCFRHYYGNYYLLKLKDEHNNETIISFNGETIDNYTICTIDNLS